MLIYVFQKELQNLDDAADELMMAEDEDSLIPYPLKNIEKILNAKPFQP